MFVLVALVGINTVSASPAVSPSNPIEIEVVSEWTEYKTIDGIKIEYKFQAFESGTFRNQSLVLFRFTNTTSEDKSMTWVTEEYRNGDCYNCHRIEDSEYSRTITLTSGQVLEGTGADVTKTEEYLFSNFVKLVPGMSNTRLTDFKFVNVETLTL